MARIGLVGGTGDLGTALALQLSKKHEVLLGSRSLDKAQSSIEEIKREKGEREYLEHNLRAVENVEVVKSCDIVLITIPHENALETIQNLSNEFRGNQVLISTVAAVRKIDEEFGVDLSCSGKSFAQMISEIVPKSVKVAAAFQTVPANILFKERDISADVLVSANEVLTYETVAALVADIEGLRPLYLGSLNLSGEIESLTSLLLNVAKKNKLRSPTLKFNSF